MNKLRYKNHPIWPATIGSTLIFRYKPEIETHIHSFVIEVCEMYTKYLISMFSTSGQPFYQKYGDKQTALDCLDKYLKFYKEHSEESFKSTEVNMYDLIKRTQGEKAVRQLCTGSRQAQSDPVQTRRPKSVRFSMFVKDPVTKSESPRVSRRKKIVSLPPHMQGRKSIPDEEIEEIELAKNVQYTLVEKNPE